MSSVSAMQQRSQEDQAKHTKKRLRRKPQKKRIEIASKANSEDATVEDDVEVEYVAPDLLDSHDPAYDEFKRVMEAFAARAARGYEDAGEGEASPDVVMAGGGGSDDEAPSPDDAADEGGELSNKKARKYLRLSVPQLKTLVKRAELVEWTDVTAKDPLLVVALKSARGSVPVPGHWSQKRKYLAGKRGFEKAPFELPSFIRETGIMEMRAAVTAKEAGQGLKTKTRARLMPKLGKINLDYERLHDAFFRFQTKPQHMTKFGELYFEGKEAETGKRFKDKRPGVLSEEARLALGMLPLAPPPWLFSIQRYGPPPSYPHLKIPGLNTVIPDGAQWGYQPGGWGKPPVDEYNQPLYGDVFGLQKQFEPTSALEAPVQKDLWGELQIDSFADMAAAAGGDHEDGQAYDGDHQMHDGHEEADMDGAPLQPASPHAALAPVQPLTEMDVAGFATPSGLSTIGLVTPDTIELRKSVRKGMEAELAAAGTGGPSAYTILPPKASGPGYVMQDVSIDASDVDALDQSATLAKYVSGATDKVKLAKGEDLTDMVRDHAAKQADKASLKKKDKKVYKF